MRVIIQRVEKADVIINKTFIRKIGEGLLVLVGFENTDNIEDIKWICRKIIGLRVFNDEIGIMNKSVEEINGEIMIISQFTLHASTKKGNRPSYIRASKPIIALTLYKEFVEILTNEFKYNIVTGEFGADMSVSLINNGPVTIFIDSKNRE